MSRTATNNSQPFVQAALFHEDFNDALRGVVAALGGAKAVGSRLFPDLNGSAQSRVLDCLNPDRPQQFSPTQVVLLLKWAREAGHHAAMHYLADDIGYTRPTPIDPEDQRAELQRQFLDGVSRLEQMAKRLAR